MTYPPDAAMFTLLGFHLRERVVILDGQPVLRITEPGFMGSTLYRIVVKPESRRARGSQVDRPEPGPATRDEAGARGGHDVDSGLEEQTETEQEE